MWSVKDDQETRREKSNEHKTHEFLFTICDNVRDEHGKMLAINHHYFYGNSASKDPRCRNVSDTSYHKKEKVLHKKLLETDKYRISSPLCFVFSVHITIRGRYEALKIASFSLVFFCQMPSTCRMRSRFILCSLAVSTPRKRPSRPL